MSCFIVSPATMRIRRCNGNRDAWILVRVRDDGTESNSYGSFETAYSIDQLLSSPTTQHLLRGGERIELVWQPI